MSNTFEHNSATHKQALQKHFSRPTDYGFFTALRQPDEIETMSWGGSDALPLLLDCVRHNFYHTYLVKHEHAQALVAELVDIVHETANDLKGTKRWKEDESVYIALWKSSENTHCIVGVGSTLQHGFGYPTTPCSIMVEHDPVGSLEDGFEFIEEQLENGYQPPLHGFFSALLEHIHAPHDSTMEVLETTVLNWIEDFSGDEELNVSKAWHTWRAQQQQNLLQNEIGDTPTVAQKRKIL